MHPHLSRCLFIPYVAVQENMLYRKPYLQDENSTTRTLPTYKGRNGKITWWKKIVFLVFDKSQNLASEEELEQGRPIALAL